MTVSTEVNHNEYTGNGVTTSFPYTFRIFRASDLVVVTTNTVGTIRTLTLNTDYTVTGAGSYSGGAIVLSSPLGNGWGITIDRELPVVQETDLRNQGKFFAETHEGAFDYLTMLIQQCFGWLRLALLKPSFFSRYYDAKQNRISNLADPGAEQDAVNNRSMRNYVDAAIAGVVGGFGWFIQYGAGAVYRTFQDKMRDTISVADFGALPGQANSAVTTAAFNAAFAAASGKRLLVPPFDYYIDSTILGGFSNTTIDARGARFYSTFDGLMFDLNPDANPSNIEATSKAYINWYGGTFQCLVDNPVNAVALRIYGIRQSNIENCIFGNSGKKTLNAGIQIAGLGGHLVNKNRWLLVDVCIDCPQWATSSADLAGPITTSSFIGNNFILALGQKAFYVRGGWNRWIIQGGFVNGSGVPVFHFTNYADCKGLNIIGVGFEQAVAGGKCLYIQDTSGLSASSINISGSAFNGDPTGGNHVSIDLERCINVSVGDGTRVEGSTARNNFSVRCDANCQDIVIDPSCRLPDPGVGISMARAQIAMGKTFQRISELILPGYNGDAKSSGTVTLDMKTLMGGNYPRQLAPLAYDLIVHCRDSGSAASTATQVEVSKNTGSPRTRSIINLRGLPNDTIVGGSVHVNAEADGSIVLVFTASGVGTLDVWVYVTAVYN